MSRWSSEPICERCWPAYAVGSRGYPFEPTRLRGYRRADSCCICLARTSFGAFIRVDAERVPFPTHTHDREAAASQPKLLTPEELAALLRLPPETIADWIEADLIPHGQPAGDDGAAAELIPLRGLAAWLQRLLDLPESPEQPTAPATVHALDTAAIERLRQASRERDR